MSFIPALKYVIGIGVVGFAGWILNGIKDTLLDAHIHEAGWSGFTFLMYVWAGFFIVYLIFGGWWVIREYTEENYFKGGNIG